MVDALVVVILLDCKQNPNRSSKMAKKKNKIQRKAKKKSLVPEIAPVPIPVPVVEEVPIPLVEEVPVPVRKEPAEAPEAKVADLDPLTCSQEEMAQYKQDQISGLK